MKQNLSRREFGKLTFGALGTSLLPPASPGMANGFASQALDFTLNATPAMSTSLDGQWKIARDPENRGKGEKWYERSPAKDAELAYVPNPLELTFPGYDGVVWYWRSFDAGDLANYDDVRIHFGGADYFAEAWLNGQYLGGNESALLPFAFSIKKALRSGTNQLAVRVIDACYAKEIDGFQLGHVPGGRQADDPLQPGFRHHNYGGLLLPVSVQAFRQPWIADGFIRPDIKNGKNDIDLIMIGEGRPTDWNAEVRPVYPQSGEPVVQRAFRISPDAQGRSSISIKIPNPRLWKIWDGFLYQITLSPKGKRGAGTTWKARFGMREVSILDGRIAINGEQILQRSFLYNQIWPVTLGVPFKDMARRDIELTRRVNANMLRCFSKTPLPATAEAADEAGILLQHESLGSWYLERGEKEHQRLKNITERGVLLLRNHPSLLWWNILNENSPHEEPGDKMLLGPFALKEVLPSLHVLDPSRPAICNDPIWRDVPNIWEPKASQPSLPLFQNHYYQFTALENHEESWQSIRGRAWGHKPQPNTPFQGITEWGQNSSPEWDRLIHSYQSSDVRQDAEDYVVYRKLRDMNQGWYNKSGVAARGFPTFESVEKANRESVAERYKEHFALFWGNIHSVGHGMTSLEDSSYELSGVVDNWRNPKPVVFEALTELNRPLQISLWLRPAAVYAHDAIIFDATLVNEGRRLASGEYPLVLKLVNSQNRVVLTKEYHHQTGTDPIEFLLLESLPLAVEPGLYELQLELQTGPSSLSAGRPVQVFERKPASLNIASKVWVWEKGDQIQRWLRQRGAVAGAGDLARVLPRDLLIVDELTGPAKTISDIQKAVRQGARAIVLRPEMVLGGAKPPSLSFSALLEPVISEWKPELREISWWGSPGAWGYSRTALALKHPFLEGLPQAVALEAQPAYQRVAPKLTWLMTGVPELANANSAVVESSLHIDCPYTADLFSVASGNGTLVLNTLHLAENLNSDPAADRILENILRSLGQS